MGHSEGGLIAPMVAAKTADVAFIVLLAGPGVPGDDLSIAQSGLIAKTAGAKDGDIAKRAAISRRMYDALRTVKDDEALAKALAECIQERMDNLPEPERMAVLAQGSKVIERQIARLTSPWYRFFLTFDPRPTLSKVKCPVLAINGEKDLQVPPKQNLPEIAKALKNGGNSNVTIVELPGLNHLFQTCKTGLPDEYAQIEETFAPAALEVVGDWIVKNFGSK